VIAFIESRVTQTTKNTPQEGGDNSASDLAGSVPTPILKEVVDLFPPSAEITPESLLALLRKWGKKAKPGPVTGKPCTDVEVVGILDSAEGSQGPEQEMNISKSQPLAARAIAAAFAAAQKR
jgi:hypothetical protein